MNVREWARHRLHTDLPVRAVDALAHGSAGAQSSGLPALWDQSIRSFYEYLHEPGAARRCIGTACTFARSPARSSDAGPHGDPHAHDCDARDARDAENEENAPDVTARCLGRCYEAPADEKATAAPIPRRSLAREPVVLRHLLAGHGLSPGSDPFGDYALPGGDAILAAVTDCGLRGRGGAAYPTGAKWKAARDTPATDRIVVANGDEGDPGAYVDRLLLEEAPHSVLAGMLACARSIDATSGIVYVRGEYPYAAECMRRAVAEAEARGVLGGLRIDVVTGAGSYVAGEETALLRSIEGLRAEPAPKPPFPAVRGLHGLPTVIQNIETLSVIPWIAQQRRRADTKAVCLSGAVRSPGVVEIDLGTTLRRVLEDGGGGAAAGTRWEMALVGGPLGRVVPESEFDVALSFESLPGMGHAGVVVFDDRVRVRALAEHLFEFARGESCGSCAPCRIGTGMLPSRRDRDGMERLLATLEEGSLCGFGSGVPRPIRDLLRIFGDEVLGDEVPA